MSSRNSRGNGNLSTEENNTFFRILGNSCQSLCTTIAQVYESDNSGHYWKKLNTGLLCFIKDNGKRSYYMRMYCLMLHRMIWEQEVYNELIIDRVCPFYLEFEGQRGMIGLNFAFVDECFDFIDVVMTTIEKRKQRRQEKVNMERQSNMKRTLSNNPTNVEVSGYQTPQNNRPIPYEDFKRNDNKKKDKKKKKLSKDDIGMPKDFRHESHIGCEGSKSFGYSEEIQKFMEKVGLTENQLKKPEIKDVVDNFIRTNNVKEVIRRESMMPKKAPPIPKSVPPAYTKNRPREVPPIPSQPPSLPPKTNHQKFSIKHTPPVSSSPGPPPPPIPSSVPPPPPVPLPTQLKTAEIFEAPKPVKQLPPVSDPRNDLLLSIQKGITLRKVNCDDQNAKKERPQSKGDKLGSDALADALKNVLDRRLAIAGDTESEDDDNDLDEEWED